jgi:putative restriction endonuclease
MPAMLGESGQQLFEGPVDRATMLVSRKVRDAKFRRAVLHVYEGRCALTGMRLVNGGGRLETEAAHIMAVGEGGPDAVNNGIALSGTVHWMFDRGLIGLSDSGDILLSSKINDREGVEKMIYPDRRARWPSAPAHRPHPRYLAWHRERFGFQAQN